MPVGNVSYYNRRKYSPQPPSDHQSRVFFGDYAGPEGDCERSRSNGSVSSSAASHQSSSSCVSVNSATSSDPASSASAAADAANANLLSLPSAGQGVGGRPRVAGDRTLESASIPASGCVDSVPTPSPCYPSDCGVRPSSPLAVAGSGGGVGVGGASSVPQQVVVGRPSVSESSSSPGFSIGGAGAGGLGSANIGVPVQQRRVEGPPCGAAGSGGSNDQTNGPLLLRPPVVASSAARTAGRQQQPSATAAPSVPFTVTSAVSSGAGPCSSVGCNNNEEFGLPLSPGPESSTYSNYQLGSGSGSELLHQPRPPTAIGSSTARQHQQQPGQHPYSKQPLQLQQPQSAQPCGVTYQPSGAGSSACGLRAEGNHQQQYQQSLPPHSAGSVNVNVTVNVVARSVAAGTMTTTTATATSTTTLAPPRPMQKVIPTVVYLMSRIAVHMEIEGTAQCPAQVMLAAALGCEELGITNKLLAQSVFGLWMTSPLLEVQLKPHHRPYAVRVAWSKLLDKHSHGNELEKLSDEPMTTLRRNVFFSRRDEEKIKDPRILELLYEEARHNVLLGRYVMEPSQSIMLGGIQARIELGPYNSHTHTTSYFRENQFRFLPAHVAKSSSWSWLPISQRSSAEVRLLEQFKRVPTTATTKKLMRKYLEFCWGLPFYGAAYFHGQVEQPVRGLMSLMQQKDLPVLIAVNERGIFVIDQIECTLLLGLKYEEFSWEYARPSNMNDPECLPCIFLQFGAVENGIAATKLMQIFSRQAAMVDALITHFIEQDKRRKESGPDPADQVAGGLADNTYVEPNPIKNNGIGVLSNKFSRLTLATFDDEGRCIGQTGSLSISY